MNKNKLDQDKLSGLYILLFAVIVIWTASICIIPYYYPNLTDRGVFGDSFGVINSLFSAPLNQNIYLLCVW